MGWVVCLHAVSPAKVLFAKGVMKNIWEISQLLSPGILTPPLPSLQLDDSEDCHNNSRHLFRKPAAMENVTGSRFANTFAGLKI